MEGAVQLMEIQLKFSQFVMKKNNNQDKMIIILPVSSSLHSFFHKAQCHVEISKMCFSVYVVSLGDGTEHGHVKSSFSLRCMS